MGEVDMIGNQQADKGPIEAKVKSATTAATVAGFIVWVLGEYLFTTDVPAPVEALVAAAVPALFAFAAGYKTRHTARNDRDALIANGLSVPPGQ